MHDPLFRPITINKLALDNRICMPAVNLCMARGFEVTEQIVEFYRERAAGGVGLIVVGFAAIDRLAGRDTAIGAHDDRFLPGLGRLAAAIRENGCRAAIQLNHCGRYASSDALGGEQPVAPSPIPSTMTRETPRELTIPEIERLVAAFAAAAGRARRAGFDAIEILHGTGYLISEFLSPLTNKRTDRYGGSDENRMRFGLEVMQAVRQEVGPDFPLLARINGNDFMAGGSDREALCEYARQLEGAGTADALCINVGWHEARIPQIIANVPRGGFAYLPARIKAAVTVPVIASHRINDPALAREMLAAGACDMVAMARPLIADPDLPSKAKAGRENQILHCIACAQGCFDNIRKGKTVECLCNPRAGHESDPEPEPAAQPRSILVIGGGPAGMSAALAASERGHRVMLVERGVRLGGQLLLAGSPPGRTEFLQLADDLATELLRSPVVVKLGREADEALVDAAQPDAVILASGAEPLTPSIPGAKLPLVVQAWEVLQEKVATGRRVVIVGGGAVGVETAQHLAEQGTLPAETLKFLLINRAETPEALADLAMRGNKRIVLLEMGERIGRDIGPSTRWSMLQDLTRSGVSVRTGSEVVEITPAGVRVRSAEGIDEIAADTVVLAIGARPYAPLADLLERKGIECHVVGDARRIALAFDAVHQGHATGMTI